MNNHLETTIKEGIPVLIGILIVTAIAGAISAGIKEQEQSNYQLSQAEQLLGKNKEV